MVASFFLLHVGQPLKNGCLLGKTLIMRALSIIDRIRALGASVLAFIHVSGSLTCLLTAVVRSIFGDHQRHIVVMRQLYRIGYQSLPVVVLTGVSMGLVIAVQGYATLHKFDGENATGGMVNFSLVTQIMPVMTGLILAGRVGSSIAAELGAMQVTEQIDALRVMGTNPISYLVAPRFIACVTLMPLLTGVGMLVGMMSAAWLVVGLWDVDGAAYWAHSRSFVSSWEILTGVGKTVVYGAIVSLVACYKGLRTEGGATGVGAACTEAVVLSSMLILVTTFVMTVVLQKLWDSFFSHI